MATGGPPTVVVVTPTTTLAAAQVYKTTLDPHRVPRTEGVTQLVHFNQ